MDVLNSITMTPDDQELTKQFRKEPDPVISKQLTKMRVEQKVSSFKNHRVHGILPEDITNELVFYSMFPGDNADILAHDGSNQSIANSSASPNKIVEAAEEEEAASDDIESKYSK